MGDTTFELHHARGETDDHTWTWVSDGKVLCCGDLFIWASPNAGNPQKVQRYPAEWAAALRQMVELQPELLLPGHGWPVVGAERVRQALSETAELLEFLVSETLSLMNAEARLDEILHSIHPPARLLQRPYLQPVYDEPEFVVRNIWRLYGGWWDGNPSSLKPAPEAALAGELAQMCGGAGRLAERALALLDEARNTSDAERADTALRLAGHLSESAWLAVPDDPEIRRVRATVFAARAQRATSTMAKGVFNWASRESTTRSGT
ncbi:MAG TPA: alkyl sulfatase dimerization domain-containing protein [Acidimicrobiales bacterium]|nr:alkyl sulfatase dimerization domain-containing protein [Acidimicrobiales bacterium]